MNDEVKILIVDDVEENLILLEEMLSGLDVVFVRASSGKEALEKMEEYGCDFALALLDVMMPGMDGLELAGSIHSCEKNNELPIILITAQDIDDNLVFKGYQVGAVDYLSKPIQPEILFSKAKVFVQLYLQNKKFKSEISERAGAEEALRIEKDNLMRIFEAMEDGIYIVNQEYDILYTNPVLKKEFGSHEGRKCYEYFHNRTKVCRWCKNPEVFSGQTVRWEWTSSRNQRTYDLIDTPLKNPDGSVSKLEIFRDITGRKRMEEKLIESEKHYKEAQSLAHVGHWEYKPIEDKLFWSEELYLIFDVDRDIGPLSIEKFLERIHPEDRDLLRTQMEKGEGYRSDYRIVMDNGSVKHIHEEVIIVRPKDGKMIRMRGVAQDITRQKEIEEEMKKNLEDLQRFKVVTVDREKKMIALKKEVNVLSEELGRSSVYDLSFLDK